MSAGSMADTSLEGKSAEDVPPRGIPADSGGPAASADSPATGSAREATASAATAPAGETSAGETSAGGTSAAGSSATASSGSGTGRLSCSAAVESGCVQSCWSRRSRV